MPPDKFERFTINSAESAERQTLKPKTEILNFSGSVNLEVVVDNEAFKERFGFDIGSKISTNLGQRPIEVLGYLYELNPRSGQKEGTMVYKYGAVNGLSTGVTDKESFEEAGFKVVEKPEAKKPKTEMASFSQEVVTDPVAFKERFGFDINTEVLSPDGNRLQASGYLYRRDDKTGREENTLVFGADSYYGPKGPTNREEFDRYGFKLIERENSSKELKVETLDAGRGQKWEVITDDNEMKKRYGVLSGTRVLDKKYDTTVYVIVGIGKDPYADNLILYEDDKDKKFLFDSSVNDPSSFDRDYKVIDNIKEPKTETIDDGRGNGTKWEVVTDLEAVEELAEYAPNTKLDNGQETITIVGIGKDPFPGKIIFKRSGGSLYAVEKSDLVDYRSVQLEILTSDKSLENKDLKTELLDDGDGYKWLVITDSEEVKKRFGVPVGTKVNWIGQEYSVIGIAANNENGIVKGSLILADSKGELFCETEVKDIESFESEIEIIKTPEEKSLSEKKEVKQKIESLDSGRGSKWEVVTDADEVKKKFGVVPGTVVLNSNNLRRIVVGIGTYPYEGELIVRDADRLDLLSHVGELVYDQESFKQLYKEIKSTDDKSEQKNSQEGRNASEFLGQFFSSRTNSVRKNFEWRYDPEQNLVYMKINADRIPSNLIDSTEEVTRKAGLSKRVGESDLRILLEGKQVRNIKGVDGKLYIKILEGNNRQVEIGYTKYEVDDSAEAIEEFGAKPNVPVVYNGTPYNILGVTKSKTGVSQLVLVNLNSSLDRQVIPKEYFGSIYKQLEDSEVIKVDGTNYVVSKDVVRAKALDLEIGKSYRSIAESSGVVTFGGVDAYGLPFFYSQRDKVAFTTENTISILSPEDYQRYVYELESYRINARPEVFERLGVKKESIAVDLDTNIEYTVYGLSIDGDVVVRQTSAVVRQQRLRTIDSTRFQASFISKENDTFIKHFEAKRSKADHFKESAHFQALMKLIKSDPDLNEEYQLVVGRHQEFKNIQNGEAGERHRDYTGMLSAMMLSPRIRTLFNIAIDKTFEDQSNIIKERIENDEDGAYIEEIVIGSGVYASIMATTKQMYLPKNPSLIIEQNSRVGGQFAQYGDQAFLLNSRTRPEEKNNPYLPGTSQALNTFTEHAALQPADSESLSYSYQSSVGDTVRVNLFLSGRAMVNVSVKKIRKNFDTERKGKYILECLDEESNKIIEVATDRVVLSSGLGEEVARLDSRDFRTNQILASEKSSYEKGEDARVMSFTQLVKRTSDPTNPFPIKGMKRVILSGEGDSANVAAGILLGYESRLGKTSMQIDKVEEIIWIGTDFPSKERFLQGIRVRYARLGLEFPRERAESYYSRIRVVQGERVSKLRNSDSGKDIIVETTDGEEYSGDHYVYCHGFEDKTNEIVAYAYSDSVTGGEINDVLGKNGENLDFSSLVDRKGFSIYYKSGFEFKSLEVTDVVAAGRAGDLFVSLRLVTDEGFVKDEVYKLPDEKIVSKLFSSKNVERVEAQSSISRILNRTENVMSGDVPIASRYRSEDIYKVGVAAKLTPTDQERSRSDAVRNIPENSASIFLYAAKAKDFATVKYRDEARSGKEFEADLLQMEKPEKIELEKIKRGMKKESVYFSEGFNISQIEELPYEKSSSNYLRFAVAESLINYEFPDNFTGMTLMIERSDLTTEDYVQFYVESDKLNLAPTRKTQKMVESIFGNSLFISAVEKATRKKNNKTGKIELFIPVYDKKVLPGGIGYRTNA